MKIVKIGGSLWNKPELIQWLAILAEQSKKSPIIIVPGGGPFADTVRDTQKQKTFSESAAHHMAILAMSQFGIMLADLHPELEPFYYPSQQQIHHRLSIWLPDKQLLSVENLAHSWNITSDSLALWLSQQLHANALHIIKSITPTTPGIAELSEAGILDKGFLDLYQQTAITTQLFHYKTVTTYPDQGLTLQP